MKKNEDKMKQNLEVIERFLVQHGLTLYGNEEAGLIMVCFNGTAITFQVSDDLLDIEVSAYKEIPENAYQEAVSYLNMVNRLLKEGQLEMVQEKEVSYRITSNIGSETTLQSSQLDELLNKTGCIGLWMEGSSKIIDEGLTAEDALKVVMKGRFEWLWEELLSE